MRLPPGSDARLGPGARATDDLASFSAGKPRNNDASLSATAQSSARNAGVEVGGIRQPFVDRIADHLVLDLRQAIYPMLHHLTGRLVQRERRHVGGEQHVVWLPGSDQGGD